VRLTRLSISRKLALLCLAFGVLPVVAVASLVLSRSTTTVRERTADRLKEGAAHVADKIDRNLFERYGDVQAFGLNEVAQDRSQWYRVGSANNRIVERMNAYVAAYGVYPIMQLLDTQGRVIAVNDRDAAGAALASASLFDSRYDEAPWFKACLAGQFTRAMPHSAAGNSTATGTVIEAAHVDPLLARLHGDAGATVIGFAAPVRDRNGEVLGCWRQRCPQRARGQRIPARRDYRGRQHRPRAHERWRQRARGLDAHQQP
jgi:hypothetical protein